MKYVFIRRADGTEFAAFCLAPMSHGDLAAAHRRDESATVVSAGFVEFHADKAFTFGWSESLRLGPRPGDAPTLTVLYRATVTLGQSTGPKFTPPSRF